MSDTSQASYALDQGWNPVAWTRDFDEYRATIMVAPTGKCVWRVQSLTRPNDKWHGEADNLKEAHETTTRIVQAKPLLIFGPSALKG